MNFLGKYSQWRPVVIYDFDGTKFMLQGRKNLNTGELHFKNKRLNSRFTSMHNMPQTIFDPKVQFEQILSQTS